MANSVEPSPGVSKDGPMPGPGVDHPERSWKRFSIVIVCGWVSLTTVVAGVGLWLTGPMVGSELIEWDERIPQQWEDARTASWDTWTRWGSGLGDTFVVIGVAVLVGAVLLLLHRWAATLLLASALLLEVSVFVTTTLLVERDRPDVAQLDVSPPTSSYPSGHTAAAFALYGSLALLVTLHTRSVFWRIAAWLVAVGAVATVGLSRIYRGMHHPTDVIVGVLVGGTCIAIAYYAVRAWNRQDDLFQEGAP